MMNIHPNHKFHHNDDPTTVMNNYHKEEFFLSNDDFFYQSTKVPHFPVSVPIVAELGPTQPKLVYNTLSSA